MDFQNKEILNLIDEARKIVENDEEDLSHLNHLLSRDTLLPYAYWNKDKQYTRICLHLEEQFELILICWQPNAKTLVHNHNDQKCWVFFFDTDFEEMIYCSEGKNELRVNKINKGSFSSMKETNNCHSLQNLSQSPAMSLHLYNEPITTCEIIKQSDCEGSLQSAELEYDTTLSFN